MWLSFQKINANVGIISVDFHSMLSAQVTADQGVHKCAQRLWFCSSRESNQGVVPMHRFRPVLRMLYCTQVFNCHFVCYFQPTIHLAVDICIQRASDKYVDFDNRLIFSVVEEPIQPFHLFACAHTVSYQERGASGVFSVILNDVFCPASWPKNYSERLSVESWSERVG